MAIPLGSGRCRTLLGCASEDAAERLGCAAEAAAGLADTTGRRDRQSGEADAAEAAPQDARRGADSSARRSAASAAASSAAAVPAAKPKAGAGKARRGKRSREAVVARSEELTYKHYCKDVNESIQWLRDADANPEEHGSSSVEAEKDELIEKLKDLEGRRLDLNRRSDARADKHAAKHGGSGAASSRGDAGAASAGVQRGASARSGNDPPAGERERAGPGRRAKLVGRDPEGDRADGRADSGRGRAEQRSRSRRQQGDRQAHGDGRRSREVRCVGSEAGELRDRSVRRGLSRSAPRRSRSRGARDARGKRRSARRSPGVRREGAPAVRSPDRHDGRRQREQRPRDRGSGRERSRGVAEAAPPVGSRDRLEEADDPTGDHIAAEVHGRRVKLRPREVDPDDREVRTPPRRARQRSSGGRGHQDGRAGDARTRRSGEPPRDQQVQAEDVRGMSRRGDQHRRGSDRREDSRAVDQGQDGARSERHGRRQLRPSRSRSERTRQGEARRRSEGQRERSPEGEESVLLWLPHFPIGYYPWLKRHGTKEQWDLFRGKLQQLREMGPQGIRMLEERCDFEWHGWNWIVNGNRRTW